MAAPPVAGGGAATFTGAGTVAAGATVGGAVASAPLVLITSMDGMLDAAAATAEEW